ncbi:MAG: hypothetical protein S4CHLAM6_14820 [Chlamydiae bacterium]|nr:hypothetical protein [Chlamydiota bacterium]
MFKITLCLLLFSSMHLFSDAHESPSTNRVLQFENKYVKVWKTLIMPNQPLSMHRHNSSRVIVPLKGGTLQVIEQNGREHDLEFREGSALWLEKDPPNQLHADINRNSYPIEVMVIEVKSE